MMRTVLLLLFISTVYSCNLTEKRLAKKCCEKTENIFSVGTGKIYVPDIVTNNGDGVNDLFVFWADSNINPISFIRLDNSFGKEIVNEKDFDEGVDFIEYLINDTIVESYPMRVYRLYNFDKAGRFQLKIIATDKSGTVKTIKRDLCFITTNDELPDDFCSDNCFFPGGFTGNGFANYPFVEVSCD